MQKFQSDFLMRVLGMLSAVLLWTTAETSVFAADSDPTVSSDLEAPSRLQSWQNASWNGAELWQNDKFSFQVQQKDEPEKIVQIYAEDRDRTGFLKPRVEADCLVVDASAMKEDGHRNLTLQFFGLDPKAMKNEYYSHFVELQGPKGGEGRLFFEGKTLNGTHFWRMMEIKLDGSRQYFEFEELIPDDLKELFLRYDFTKPGEYRFFRSIVRTEEAQRADAAQRKARQIFYLPLDGSADAAESEGKAEPLEVKGLHFVPGVKGQAVRFSGTMDQILKFAREGNLNEECGTISAWVRLNWATDADGKPLAGLGWRMLLSESWHDPGRIGSGAIWYWIYEGRLRGDSSDVHDLFITRPMTQDSSWHHIVFTWDEFGKSLYLDGDRIQRAQRKGNMASPTRPMQFVRTPFDTFFIGRFNGHSLEGDLDELRIYSAPVSPEEVNRLYREFRTISCQPKSRYFFEDEPLKMDGVILNSGKSSMRLKIQLLTDPLSEQKDADIDRAEALSEPKVLAEQEILAESGEKPWMIAFPAQKPGLYQIRLLAAEGAGIQAEGAGIQAEEELAVWPIWVFHAKNTTGQALSASRATQAQLWNEDLKLKLVDTIDVVQIAEDAKAKEDAKVEGATKVEGTTNFATDRFSQVGSTHTAELNGVKYLETAPTRGDRFAIRLKFPKIGCLYLLEYDFPDDKCRSTDIILQAAQSVSNDYDLQVGYVTGDEYPNSGKMMTQRYFYYPRSSDAAILVMSARTMPAGAALAKVRIYEVESPLPTAQISPAAPIGGWTRPVGIYFEDPAVGYDFGAFGYLPQNVETMLDRLCAYMKYSGQNMFSYPFVWYEGVIGEQYNPRNHPPRCAEAFAKKFDREGLEFMVTFNQNEVSFEVPTISRSDIKNGRLYDSIFTIHNTGTPHPGGWHDSPPVFNILHPDVQKNILDEFDEILDVCADHPSFKGIVIHLPMHSLNSLGDIRTGYNDYMIRGFEKDTGILVAVDKTDPLRGRLYYEWLMANAREEWVNWRCQKLSEWYAVLAKRLSDRRSDLKLGIHCITPILYAKTVYDDQTELRDFWLQVNRDMGIDARYLAEIPNVFVEQSVFPADYRWMHERRDEDLRRRLRQTEERVGMYASLLDAPNAWVHQFDRYWESAIGNQAERGGEPNVFPADWLKECSWRVTTLNPCGFQAMKHYIMPLRFKDVQGLSKGGFLIGTYGMEPELVAFAQAFRALPAVEFEDVEFKDVELKGVKPVEESAGGSASETVKIRRWSDGKNTWFYVVNTDLKPVEVTIQTAPGQILDLGRNLGWTSKGTDEIRVEPYTLRSFRVSGEVQIRVLEIAF